MSSDLIRSLARDLSNRRLSVNGVGYDMLDAYYSGQQPIAFIHPDVLEQVQGRLQNLVINWARVIVGSIEERLDIEGFRLGIDDEPPGSEAPDADDDLWRIWQANDLDEWSQLAHVDAMVHGRAFISVWGSEDLATPRIAVESATQMTVAYRPGTAQISAALKVWSDGEPDPNLPNSTDQTAVLYLPDSVEWWQAKARAGATQAAWTKIDELPNPLGAVPVVPLVNRPRLTDLCGESELVDVLPLVDAVNKLGTDMMVASEKQAMGDRWATGIEVPRDARANARLQEEVRQKWDEATKGKTWLAGPGVNFGQFPAAQLDNFIGAIKMLVSQIAAIAGLPPHYLGLSGDNPASADAIRSAEASLVKKALRKQRGFGGSWERAMRLAVATRDGVPLEKIDPALKGLETQWRDPTTPTPGAKADAAVKLVAGDIITRNQAREDLGYSPAQIERMDREAAEAQAAQVTADVAARVNQANQLMADQGISQPAAFAAVGLLAAAQQMTPGSPTATPSVAPAAKPAAP